MSGVNMVVLVGHLGADPETRYTAGGSAITNIRIATSEQWTDKQSGQKQERTEWHRITFFGRLAEIADEYLKKGRQVYVRGKLRTDKYTDREGVERYSTNVVADQLTMLGGGQGERPQGSGHRRGASEPSYDSPSSGGDTFEDDSIPF